MADSLIFQGIWVLRFCLYNLNWSLRNILQLSVLTWTYSAQDYVRFHIYLSGCFKSLCVRLGLWWKGEMPCKKVLGFSTPPFPNSVGVSQYSCSSATLFFFVLFSFLIISFSFPKRVDSRQRWRNLNFNHRFFLSFFFLCCSYNFNLIQGSDEQVWSPVWTLTTVFSLSFSFFFEWCLPHSSSNRYMTFFHGKPTTVSKAEQDKIFIELWTKKSVVLSSCLIPRSGFKHIFKVT